MYLASLRLENFRNYSDLELTLKPGMTVLQGANGEGKTNLLEAVHFLSLLRSFRTVKVSELIGFSASSFRVEGVLNRGGEWLSEEELAVFYGDQRHLRINRQPVSRASLFINRFLCVSLTPQDINLVKGAPGLRRRFCNILGGQIRPEYLTDLINYNVALRHRNEVLRHPRKYGAGALAAYDGQLVEYGAAVMMERKKIIAELNYYLDLVAKQLEFTDHSPHLRYAFSIGLKLEEEEGDNFNSAGLKEQYHDILLREQNRDEEYGCTRFGPHRDDLYFYREQKSVAAFASEGECRLFVLALKLAAAKMVIQIEQAKPVVLLVDDVFGELDPRRRRIFLQNLGEYQQSILACTAIPPELSEMAHTEFSVKAGKLTKNTFY